MPNRKLPTIWFDAGHGMGNRVPGQYDPGAMADNVAEADIALQWVLTAKFVLAAAGFTVYLTRDDRTDPSPVGLRDDRAKAAGADLFISIHCNAATGTATGTETFYRDSDDKKLAALVQKALLRATGLRDRGLKTEGDSQHSKLAIFGFPGPACLAEIGFIDNPADRARLLSKEVRIAFAEALRDELLKWFS